MANVGDKVKVSTEKGEEEGILMPSPDEYAIIIKLGSGYNLGFEKKSIKSLVVLEEKKQEKKQEKKHMNSEDASSQESAQECSQRTVKNNLLQKVAVLHTGGTIASKVDYKTGAVTAQFTAADLLGMFPEIEKIACVETELVSNIMSEDMLFSDYMKIAAAVKRWAAKVDGIIIGHGTDTLGYTAAALAFMFEKINIPVLLVGSQRSSDRGSTDAASNLLSAVHFITKSDFAGVAVCMHYSSNDDRCAILPATKTRKMHTSRRDAFKAVNSMPIALIDPETGRIDFLHDDYCRKSNVKVVVKDKFEEKVGLLKAHPNMNSDIFSFFVNNYKAFVIEGTGLGHAPTNVGENLKNYELLKKYITEGGIVAVTSQCLYGRVHPYVYTNLRRLSEIGCIFCEDMLPETAFIKLAWLLGNYPKEEAKRLMAENIRGEINESTTYEEDFLK